MEHVEVVVKIPKMAIEYAKQYNKSCSLALDMNSVCINAIANGTQLPEGHGDIVDLNEMINAYWDGNYMEIHVDDLPNIPVIIEADKGDKLESN